VIQFDESVGGRNQFSALFSELTGEGRADDAR
jgi:hypothetical protein